MKKKYFAAPLLLVCILLSMILPTTLSAEAPVAYKGRFRPFDAYQRLKLYDWHHAQKLKGEEKLSGSQAFSFWGLQVGGIERYSKVPLLWVENRALKQALSLDPQKQRFSYEELHGALFLNEAANLMVMRLLIPYAFNKQETQGREKWRGEKVELKQLSAGLWVRHSQDRLIIAAVPDSQPWNFIKPGMTFEITLMNADAGEEALALMGKLQELQSLNPVPLLNSVYTKRAAALSDQGYGAEELQPLLESALPLQQRIRQSGNELKMLPGKLGQGEWHSLHALSLVVYNSRINGFEPIGNFTAYPDNLFREIQKSYLNLAAYEAVDKFPERNKESVRLDTLLLEGYAQLAGKPYRIASGKTLTYPTLTQLHAESVYYDFPWVTVAAALYALSLICLFFKWHKTGTTALALAFTIHTTLLALRCFILGRPPVSNMFETVIYVPWIAVLTGIALRVVLKSNLSLMAAAFVSLVLFLVLDLSGLNAEMENVQAVLDSQFWLLIHVLMVVGSYGLYALCGILGHIYLVLAVRHGRETEKMQATARSLIQAMYLGTALLISGTVLGGVWAAESWGRFWDWDPKEAWAFITACIYAMVIHAYRFRHIAHFGLAVGSILGLMAVSFTWYGVNYILGTGLHSYGFGNGGEAYYYLYLLSETCFLATIFIMARKRALEG